MPTLCAAKDRRDLNIMQLLKTVPGPGLAWPGLAGWPDLPCSALVWPGAPSGAKPGTRPLRRLQQKVGRARAVGLAVAVDVSVEVGCEAPCCKNLSLNVDHLAALRRAAADRLIHRERERRKRGSVHVKCMNCGKKAKIKCILLQ